MLFYGLKKFAIVAFANSFFSLLFFLKYQTERDGIVETRVEKKVLLGCNGEDVDQNVVRHLRNFLLLHL